MKRRKFSKLLGSSLAMTSALTSCTAGSETLSYNETSTYTLPQRWFWVRPDLTWTADQWHKMFDKLTANGFTGILPQIYGSRETLFEHPFMPMKQNWLEFIIPIAHSHGIQVHAWMWSMILNEPGMIEKHPDWFSHNRLSQPSNTHPAYVDYYKFMCPCNPEVQEFVGGMVEALAKIEDLDGIHLDYIRQPDVILAKGLQPKYDIVQDKEYPEYDYPYSPFCRDAFKAESGIDPLDLGDDAPAHQAWRQFRYDAISNIVNNHCVPAAKKQNKVISAAVFPNWESVRQNWHNWKLDAFFPMLYQGFYEEDIKWIGNEVKKGVDSANQGKIFGGLFLPHLPGQQLDEGLEEVKSNGGSGFSLFSLNDMKEDQWKVLESSKLFR